ncbi:S41 family peptidase [Magnetospira sp. QH-2]|uniref:S41 family peptidase n=1 Tax=Magnetospira sp. (strain QH-2) TaxID=1288970 RepID=UPI0003E81A13|nr:PDZ domain-containing protein [Magnetospira sp. QH-2]CCQ73119.1 protein of unknown function [Magnetospira sp. QH-2]
MMTLPRFPSAVFLAGMLLSGCAPQLAERPPTIKSSAAKVDWLSILPDRVAPLTHDRAGRWPMILWNGVGFEPLAPEQITMMLDRGLVPHLRLHANMIPAARALQAAGAPVILMQGESGPWAYAMTSTGKGDTLVPGQFEGWAEAARRMRQTMAAFRDAGVTVDAVWLDYEVAPSTTPLAEVLASPEGRAVTPPEAKISPRAFARYRRQLWTSLMSAYVAGPIREVFPAVSVTNWMTVLSLPENPVPGMTSGRLPMTDPGLFTATNPVAYGTDAAFLNLWPEQAPKDRDGVDRAYMAILLGQVSADAANRRAAAPHLKAIPWVARWVPLVAKPEEFFGGLGVNLRPTGEGARIVGILPNTPAERAGLMAGDLLRQADGLTLAGLTLPHLVARLRGAPGSTTELEVRRGPHDLSIIVERATIHLKSPAIPMMSRERYREALRHLWMRGINGMQIFNSTTPGDAETVIAEVSDAVAVYDEMLAHRRFLEDGVPLNLAVPDPNQRVHWSGLRLGNEALVRVISVAPFGTELTVRPWGEEGVSLLASARGATYKLQRVEGRIRAESTSDSAIRP